MVKVSNVVKSDFFSNPLVVVLMAIIILILLLAIFRSVSPSLTLGFGINAHIGDLKGSIALEAYDNQNSDVFDAYDNENSDALEAYDNENSDALEAYDNEYSDRPTFALFYSPTCPHCELPLAGFQELQQSPSNRIDIVTINCKENQEFAQQCNISGYPTMRFYPDGLSPSNNFTEYTGGRTVEELRDYVNKLR